MKALILKISLAVALSFGVTVGFAQQQGAAQSKNNEQETKVESVVVMKKGMTEAEVKANGEVIGRVVLDPVWFFLDNPAAPHLPGSYSFATDDDGEIVDECPNGFVRVCAIKVTPNTAMTEPDPTALGAIQDQIEEALDDGAHKPNVRLRSNL